MGIVALNNHLISDIQGGTLSGCDSTRLINMHERPQHLCHKMAHGANNPHPGIAGHPFRKALSMLHRDYQLPGHLYIPRDLQ